MKFYEETVCDILFFIPNGVDGGWVNFHTPVKLRYNRHGNLQVELTREKCIYADKSFLETLVFNREGECLNYHLPRAAPEYRRFRLV